MKHTRESYAKAWSTLADRPERDVYIPEALRTQDGPGDNVPLIIRRDQLLELADHLGVRPDWHEPDEQEVTATMHGVSFDNAGFWGKTFRSSFDGHEFTEQYVTLHKDGEAVAHVNLATLFAWATGFQG